MLLMVIASPELLAPATVIVALPEPSSLMVNSENYVNRTRRAFEHSG